VSEIIKYGNPEEGLQKGVDKGNIEILARILAQTKVLAPVAQKFGGTLRNSYMWRTDKEEAGFNNGSGSPATQKLETKPGKNEGVVGSNLDYATYQEFGTRKMAAQPHFRPSIDLVVGGQKWQEVLKKIQQEEIKIALGKGAKIVRI
jgi:phage gpG-like protein